jgi:hypothetical protein
MYRRDADPVPLNLEKAARERYLYSFPDAEGNLSDDLERQLAQLEDAVRPILVKLIGAQGDVMLTAEEEYALAHFAAFQAVRTPAQRRIAQQLIGDIGRTMAVGSALNRDAWRRSFEQAQAAGAVAADAEAEEIREYILDGDYDVVGNERYAMLLSLGLASDLVWTFHSKRLFVMRSLSSPFVTSDHPVMRFGDPEAPPMYRGGFVSAYVFMPIGRHTALYWIPDDTKHPPLSADSPVIVRSKTMAGATVRAATKDMMAAAEQFLFSSERSEHIAALFMKTTRPDRVRFSGPFDGIHERRRAEREVSTEPTKGPLR